MFEFIVEDNTLIYTGERPTDRKSAFQISLQKWAILAAQSQDSDVLLDDGGSRSCGLCMLYLTEDGANPCAACPIKLHTGAPYCRGTAYSDYSGNKFWEMGEEAIQGALRELTFLHELARRGE